ncbi:MAG: hypothetical protein M0Z54_08915 [Thermaerobacter sp.]|nr:hypothetical protein [Thermaerobacter sp.]
MVCSGLFVPQTAERALAEATPVLWQHDQGGPFASPQYTARVEAAGGADQPGRAFGGIFTQRLGRNVTYA